MNLQSKLQPSLEFVEFQLITTSRSIALTSILSHFYPSISLTGILYSHMRFVLYINDCVFVCEVKKYYYLLTTSKNIMNTFNFYNAMVN